jgi:hypothetical protein
MAVVGRAAFFDRAAQQHACFLRVTRCCLANVDTHVLATYKKNLWSGRPDYNPNPMILLPGHASGIKLLSI